MVCVGYISDNGIEKQPRVISFQEGGSLPLDKCVKSSLIKDVIVFVGVLVECGVLASVIAQTCLKRYTNVAYVVDDCKFFRALFLFDVSIHRSH